MESTGADQQRQAQTRPRETDLTVLLAGNVPEERVNFPAVSKTPLSVKFSL